MPKTVVVATNQGTRAVVIAVTITISFHAWIVSCATSIVFPVASLSSFPICNLQIEWFTSLFDQPRKSKLKGKVSNEITFKHNTSLACPFILSTHDQYPFRAGVTDTPPSWCAASKSEKKKTLLVSNKDVVEQRFQMATRRMNKVLVGKYTSAMQRIAKHCLASPYSMRCKCVWCKVPHRQQECSCSALTLYGEFYLKIESNHQSVASNQFNNGPKDQQFWRGLNFMGGLGQNLTQR